MSTNHEVSSHLVRTYKVHLHVPVVQIVLVASVDSIIDRAVLFSLQSRTNDFFSTARDVRIILTESTLIHLLKNQVCETVVEEIASVSGQAHRDRSEPLKATETTHFFKSGFDIIERWRFVMTVLICRVIIHHFRLELWERHMLVRLSSGCHFQN